MAKHKLDKDRLRYLFEYNGGFLIRKNLSSIMSNKERVGEVVGYAGNDGYMSAMVDGKTLKINRVVWAIHFGDPGELEVDHINGIRSDNRIENLRAVSKNENLKNKRLYATSKSKVSGVTWYSNNSKWLARISYGNKRKFLGYYSDFFEAVCARKSAEAKNGFHANHGS